MKKAINLIRETFNPGVISNVSWCYNAIQTYIKRQFIEKDQKTSFNEAFLVVSLSPYEISCLSINENIMFSTFCLGFISET